MWKQIFDDGGGREGESNIRANFDLGIIETLNCGKNHCDVGARDGADISIGDTSAYYSVC